MLPPGNLPLEYLLSAVSALRDRGVEFSAGLTETELRSAEKRLGVPFPPDLRGLLAHAAPRGPQFVDWRDPGSDRIAERLAWPADSLGFDIEHSGFWLSRWGERPEALEDAKAIARDQVLGAPLLIPIYGHRYLPADPCTAGNPIFSVYQTDIIYYGNDLPAYLQAEFGVPNPWDVPEKPREIELWSYLESLNGLPGMGPG